ncbi:trimeric intracellular cation channel family protein [Corynebacterium sp. HMSC034A01]|uniref:trimeric intracellular cation channel family protein n=1 Tax=Corynebacterium sp. HMSC034A01 TaxID=1739295 RepID=UPI0008A983BD|nr:TRIC cation channel family protein [Corynebacterium sp. HMSC034A01]OHR17929.1 hypothetical protein HMPREF2791_04100 [Corynebacterium sp. HMSC034A01]
MDFSDDVGNLYFVLEYTGVLLAATIGGTVAKRMNFDIVGFAFVALISSLSGGLMRDAILNDGPAAALTNPGYLITATVGGLIAFFAPLRGKLWENFRFYADVVTIGVWAVGGTIKALNAELSWVPCVLLAVITATGGTLARDIALRQVPSLFTSQKMTVFPAIIASVIMLVLNQFDLVWEGMLAAAIAAPLFAIAVYFGGDKFSAFQTKRLERPLEEKIGEALGVETDSRRPVESGEDVRNALEDASDEQFIQALRVMLQNEVQQRTEAKT